jgi:hypothetical protein
MLVHLSAGSYLELLLLLTMTQLLQQVKGLGGKQVPVRV